MKVELTQERYEQLIKKEFAYDIYAEKVRNSKYADEFEKALFGIKEEIVPEEDDF